MEHLKNIVIKGSKGKQILLDVTFEKNRTKKPIVIFSHGFKGFKDWGHFNKVAQMFAEAGFVFIKFNFSHNGTTIENPVDFKDLEAFGNNNYSIELDDLERVIDWALDCDELKNDVDSSQLNLMGHSRGGGITILKACEDARVKKIVTWAAVADFVNPIKSYDLEGWKENGVLYVSNTRTNQEMPLYYQLFENTMANTDRLDIINNLSRLSIPFLIVHGTSDEAVPIKNAKRLLENCDSAQLLLIDNAGHTFGVKHPFNDDELPEDAMRVINESISYFLTDY